MQIDAEAGASVFLVVSGRSEPIVLNGTLVSSADGRLVVAIDGNDGDTSLPADIPLVRLPAERREEPRYPTWLDATVYARRFPAGQVAVVTDLALHGASVEVDGWEDDAFFRLTFEVNGELLQIECECVHHEPTWRGVLLHTRFVLVSPDRFEVLDTVVTALRSIFGVAQESLATDRTGSLLI